MQKHKYWKLLKITAFIRRFIGNCWKVAQTRSPLNPFEIEQAEQWWVKLTQAKNQSSHQEGLSGDLVLVWASPRLPLDVPGKKAQIGRVGRGTLPPDESAWVSSVHNEQGAREVLDSTTATYY